MYRPLLMLAFATVLPAQQEPVPPPGRAAQEGHLLAQFYALRVARMLFPDRAAKPEVLHA